MKTVSSPRSTLDYAGRVAPAKKPFFTPIGLFILGGLSLAWLPMWSFVTNGRLKQWHDLVPYVLFVSVGIASLIAGLRLSQKAQ